MWRCEGDLWVGESFFRVRGVQNALLIFGGLPAEHRTDSLSACYRNRNGSYAADFTRRYREPCAHLGMIYLRNNLGVAHENVAIERPHCHWKHCLSSS